MVRIIKAEELHIDELVPLFDAYRVFYKAESNKPAVHDFLLDRIQKNESVIYLAYSDNQAVGFTQLYPIFSSVSMQSMYVLNDLYVDESYRRKGIAKKLLDKAKDFARSHSLKGLSLETSKVNPAQKLYERENWVRDDAYYHYFWTNN
jgi:GNAT superfamily N-acetyltransferase